MKRVDKDIYGEKNEYKIGRLKVKDYYKPNNKISRRTWLRYISKLNKLFN